MELNDLLLDDPEGMAEADTRELLPITASAGASMRAAATLIEPSLLDRVVDEGRPRSIVVVGGGGSRAAGDILAAVTGSGSPVSVVSAGGPSLPGWVGPTDLVAAVSASGGTPETLSVAAEAVRRGCGLLAVCPPNTALSQITDQTRAALRFDVGKPPLGTNWRARSLLWSLATPLLLVGGALGLVDDAPGAVKRAADQLDDVADRCAPSRDTMNNQAKRWAIDVAMSLPVLWGTGDVGSVAARRFGRQLIENTGVPVVTGALPEAARTQSALLAGPMAGRVEADDIFRDRVDEPEPTARLRLVLLRDADEHPGTAALADAALDVARTRGVPVLTMAAQPGHPLERLVSLIGPTDFASVYAAIALGIDPMASTNELDGRVLRS
ncbi:MAG: SIS domain-containing protein [Candidatus Nanopelagicales bacterium]|nr:hypothetical protein [Candidatus Nanopelagicales bacterium]